jgi:hypothetical protein
MATTMKPERWPLLEQALTAPEPEREGDRDRPRARPVRRPLGANHRSLRLLGKPHGAR